MVRGFSLVELSIVLVILGLLTGGILAGQSLIRAAELRSVSTEYQRYAAAVNTFRDKYFQLPGDMNSATKFWGEDNAACNTVAADGTPGTCNGNGDGTIAAALAVSVTGETQQFWKQLALAGLIEGSYSGIAGPSAAGWLGNDSVIGTNVPRSRMSNTGWAIIPLGNYVGDAYGYVYDYGNALDFGLQSTGNAPIGAALKAEEAWNIDTKVDDGKPGTGKILPRDNVGFGVANGCTTSASNTDRTGEYRLTTTSAVCALWFAKAF